MNLDDKRVDKIIRFALKEDIWTGDVTSESVFDVDTNVDAVILAKSEGMVCGIDIIEKVFRAVDAEVKFRPQVKDGDKVSAGQEVAFLEGNATSIMKAERTALNFLSILSGVSTKTKKLADKAGGVKLLDTRKTIPLHRYLEKYAVTVGGGENHRKGLYDMVLIKDNHIRTYLMQEGKPETEKVIRGIIKRAREKVQQNIKIEIEVETLEECMFALEEEPDVIMLDNMTPDMVKKAVKVRKEKGLEGKVLFEVSGGITLDNISSYAETGIDIISTGSVTSSIDPVDFSLEVILK